jgi:transcriptional antiterminator Rof (Rho-off)
MSDYHPIPCALHEGYQLAVMRRECLRVRWHDAAGAARVSVGTAMDVYTRQGEEFLLLEPAPGQRLAIRLDRIEATEGAGDPIR